MLQKVKSDYVSWIVLIGAFFLILDLFFFNRGLIFSLIVAVGMIYIGKKRMPKKTGKFLYWLGLFFLVMNMIGMLSIRFVIIASLCILISQYASRRKKEKLIQPIIKEREEVYKEQEMIIKEKTLLQNRLFGRMQTPDHVYEWNDVNIQAGIGDTIIDLSNTVLPKEETTIFIRNVIGKVTVKIPYDIEISINHSVFYGSAKVLDFYQTSLINRCIHIETADYKETDQKVKIFTSMMIGDLEVKRV